MQLKQVNDVLDHKIVNSSEFLWNCFGSTARFLDYASKFADATVIFDSNTQEIYEATIASKNSKDQPYRWLNPNTKKDFLAECRTRNIDPKIAWDNITYIDLETEEDFFEKAKAIFNNLPYDKRIQIPLNLSTDEWFHLMKIAHERDITMNQLAKEILEEVIEGKNMKVATYNKVRNNWSDNDWEQFTDWLKKMLKSNILTVTFTKKDGTERVMQCTLDPQLLPTVFENKNKKERSLNKDNLSVFDIEIGEWRSFVIKSITKVEHN